MTPRRLVPVLAVLAVLAPAAACGEGDGPPAGGSDEAGAGLSGIRRTPEPDVSGPTLPDASDGGAEFAFVAEPGRVLLVYFGFTSCPDVCPTTLADIRTARGDLGADADRVDLAMVSVDPARDRPEQLTRYVRSFHPEGHALVTGDEDRLRAAATPFGATFEVRPAPDGGEPEVSHSALVYAVDDRGRLVVSWPFGTPPDDLARDLRLLLEDV